MSFLDENYCSNAPFNQTDERRKYRVGLNMIGEFSITVPSSYDEEEGKREMKSRIMRSFADWEILDIDIE